MKKPFFFPIIFLIISNLYPMEPKKEPKNPVRRIASAPVRTEFFSVALLDIPRLLHCENFEELQKLAHKSIFVHELKKYLSLLFKDTTTPLNETHIKNLIEKYVDILTEDTIFLKNLITSAFKIGATDLAYFIYTTAQDENLLSSILVESVKGNHYDIFEKIIETSHRTLEERDSPLRRALFYTTSPYTQQLVKKFPHVFAEKKEELLENALSTYYMKTVIQLTKYANIKIPADALNQCFVYAAQQNCISFFTLPQVVTSNFPTETVVKALKAASKHNHHETIEYLYTHHPVSTQYLCDCFFKAATYNQTESAKELSLLIGQEFQTCNMKKLEEWYDHANERYAQALDAAVTNGNSLITMLILESPFPLTLNILSTLIEKTSGQLKKELLNKILHHFPRTSRPKLRETTRFIK